jgi:hypothetical protein
MAVDLSKRVSSQSIHYDKGDKASCERSLPKCLRNRDFLQDLKSLVKNLDGYIQLYRVRPVGEYSVLTYAEWAEFDGNHVLLMGRIRIHMTLIKMS